MRTNSGDVHPSATHIPGSDFEESNGSHTSVERAVLFRLERRGPMPIDELIAAIDSHPLVVERACSDLQRAGLLYTRSCGVYDVHDSETHRLTGVSVR
ncbi:hypothetical protein SAMN04487948_11483 [Halogranum amylolyticum]|uniref:MarR family protein n=1 Tax=Halogranum amylolyticum TaxID=660520 RepID=A0A1H8V685_9EURY|nr:hypothetical protein SAMN04487948_11483 [Halogranum amylolyticum]